MDNVLICLTLLSLFIISGIISRLVLSVPAPFIQIAVGAVASFFIPLLQVSFNPEVFMVLFIPPLLFSDSWHFPKREFLSNTKPIIMLSIGLVFFTVVGLGYLIHWLLPILPQAACFALAAAVSPTDAVALKSMTAKLGLPLRMWHILQGEALLNDASGLVSFKFAVAALFSGLFSIQDAFLSLILISAGGILIGVLLSYGFVWILGRLSLHRFEETTIENLLLILLPYSAYLAAEFFHSSGILAAVAAGFTIDKVGFLDRTMVNMRIEGRFVWGMLELTLNGIIFVLLGIYLPNTMHLIDEIGISFSLGFTIVGIITFSLIFLRFIWVSLMLPLDKLFTSKKTKVWQLPDFTLLLAMSFGGIRGAIALAAILSLPNFISSGIAFPARDLLIIIVVGVVLCSLILSTIVLKIVLPRLKITTSSNPLDEENTARIAAAQAGIKAVERKMSAIIKDLDESEAAVCQQVGNALMASLNLFIVSAVGEEAEKNTSLQALTYEEKLRLSALDAARHELRKLKRQGKINNTTMINMMHRLDLRQFSLMDENKIYPRKHD